MTKFINVFLITISITIFLALAALGITYLVEPNLVKDWIGIERVEPSEPNAPEEPEQPTEPEEPTEPEKPEEPTDPETPEEPEEPEATVLEGYTFEGNKLVSYTGTETDIVIPSSYSISGSEIVKMTFDEMEFQEYLMMNFEDITYPITITDANSQQYILNSEMDVFENQDIVYPVSLEVEKPIFVEGNDYQVTRIGEDAFRGINLTSVVLSDGITSIESSAFSSCSSLTSVTIPASVVNIGERAFMDCNSLTSVTFGEDSQLTNIGNLAFMDCSSLEAITIPEGVTSIGTSVFSGCSITSITIPASVTTIGDSAFWRCSSLTSVTILDGVTSIDQAAFHSCSSLESITLPASLTSIGDRAFMDCNSLTLITINSTTPPSLGSSVIPSTVTSIYVPNESVEDYKTAWSDCADYIKSIDELEVA